MAKPTKFGSVIASNFIGANLPNQGKQFFVKPYSGSDGADGQAPSRALKTLAGALAKCTAGRNDTVYLLSESNTAAQTTDYQSATLDWNKDLTHLIGVNSGVMVSQRSRVALLSTYAVASNLFTLSADGCYIGNSQFFAGVASANPTGCFKLTGTRNLVENCHIAGIGHDNNDIAGAYSLKLDGASENVFKNCAIGLDTITAGGAANAEILVDTAASRNLFDDCLIYRLIEHTTQHPLVELADATAIDRYLWFRRCLFLSMSVNYAIAQSGVFKVPVLTQGYIVVQDGSANSGKASSTVKWDVNDNNKIVLVGTAPIAAGDTAGTELLV